MDKEKVIKGLECCAFNHVDCYKLYDCPYKNAENNDTAVCVDILMRDALELIKDLENENRENSDWSGAQGNVRT